MHNQTQKLIDLMQKHKLKAADVGRILGKSPQTVRGWRCDNAVRIIPANELRLLELELAKKDA
jgi:hypothetical protein